MLKFLIQQIAELQVLEQELGSLKKNAVCIIIFFPFLSHSLTFKILVDLK